MYEQFETTVREMNTEKDLERIRRFLSEEELELEKDAEYTIGVFRKKELIGTGSLSGKVLKSLSVRKDHQGEGITNRIVTELVNEAFYRGETHLFIYTKPEYKALFEDVGFYTIAEIKDHVCLMENMKDGIHGYVRELEKKKEEGSIIGSVVMNCNPFTLGHQYLIETAAKECDVLHIFLLWEDRSSFPSEVRYELVKKGVAHLSNVKVHKGKDYVISSATFPSYFIKGEENLLRSQTLLDVEIFRKYLAPALGIRRRYVGEEPYCEVTNLYNRSMAEELPKAGIEVRVISRKEWNDVAISASSVRKGLVEGGVEEVRHLVPDSTYEFLLTERGGEIIEKMRKREGRH